MNPGQRDDLSSMSMHELFRIEADTQVATLTSGLLELEHRPAAPEQLEILMRAAHSIKGAARIVNLQAAVQVAHAMEDCFVAAQNNELMLDHHSIDLLLRGVDLLLNISKKTEADAGQWEAEHKFQIEDFLKELAAMMRRPKTIELTRSDPEPAASFEEKQTESSALAIKVPEGAVVSTRANPPDTPKPESFDRVLRLTADNLNRLLGLAGESLVESRWLGPFAGSLLRLKRQQTLLGEKLNELREGLSNGIVVESARAQLGEIIKGVSECQRFLGERMQELDMFDRRSAHLSHRLYLEVLRTRMRPFSEGAQRFPRMVRDLARTLGKEARLEISGETTPVDRDILERLETPLAHLLRNAVDHGCEAPEQRTEIGKPRQCTIRLEARHSAGMLLVIVSDDGAGLDPERVRNAIVRKKLTTSIVASKLTETELLQFLFLPGFSLKDTVTEISGRGVGLDVVQNMVKTVRGSIRASTEPGRGMRFQLQLPLTLSVLRALLVQVAGEPYAIPLSQITRTLRLSQESISSLEGRPHFQLGDQQIGLLSAQQVLDSGQQKAAGDQLMVVVLGDPQTRYGLVVDQFLGERELVVQPLDPRLGKVKDISAAALMEDGSPVLILDVADLLNSIEKLLSEGVLPHIPRGALDSARKQKRILAVDDSLTVRELERKLLVGRGYLTDVAVDGVDGWNAVRAGNYDLVITDVDMPRMDGIELARLIKADPLLKSIPVMIVSYKDREEDRFRGLDAGADYYLTKGSFNDETLLQAVTDLIGEPAA